MGTQISRSDIKELTATPLISMIKEFLDQVLDNCFIRTLSVGPADVDLTLLPMLERISDSLKKSGLLILFTK